MTSGLRRVSTIADVAAGEARLAAEVDRSVRYHRPVTVALLRIANDAILDQIESWAAKRKRGESIVAYCA